MKKEKFIAEELTAVDRSATFRHWARLTVFNLLLVAAAGLLLRIKIVFPLPAIDHKNLLHGHSHFAFSGWVSLALFTAITAIISKHTKVRLAAYNRLFWLGQLASFGMLFTFPFMGYKAPSIAFSVLSILFSYAFCWRAWRDMTKSSLPPLVKNCFRVSFIFYILSSLGAFYLAWLMASKSGSQAWYIGSVYFFLHFQYNGWFFFSILGLFFYQLADVPVSRKLLNIIFRMLAIAAVPAFFLSALWMQLPSFIYWSAAVAGMVQVIALVLFLRILVPLQKPLRKQLPAATRWLWSLSLLAFSIKIILQSLSAIPSLSYLAFGFRPVVIGYLHLILLGFVTLFLLGYFIQHQLLPLSYSGRRNGLILFTTGVLLNELFLFLQGVGAINSTIIPGINYFLLMAAAFLFTGLIFIWGVGRRMQQT